MSDAGKRLAFYAMLGSTLAEATRVCDHEWLDRPESDSRECLICGDEVFGT